MNRACKNSSEHNPKKCGRPEHYAHYGSENRSESGYVKELYKEYPPRSHRYEVNAVISGVRRHWRGCVGAYNAVYQSSIDEVSANQ